MSLQIMKPGSVLQKHCVVRCEGQSGFIGPRPRFQPQQHPDPVWSPPMHSPWPNQPKRSELLLQEQRLLGQVAQESHHTVPDLLQSISK